MKLKLTVAALLLSNCLTTSAAVSWQDLNKLTSGYPILELGAIKSSQGKSQSIRISNLIGDRYSVKNRNDNNLILGLGYFKDYPKELKIINQALNLSYGLNTFYLFPTEVKGKISQEHMFINMDYRYKSSHLPIYLAGKIRTNPLFYNNTLQAVFNFGIGPSIIHLSSYKETPLNNVTIPNNLFDSNHDVVFSLTAGVGVRAAKLLNDGVKSLPIECGYRIFFFTGSELKKNNSQVLDRLKSGNSLVNSLTCSVQFDNVKIS